MPFQTMILGLMIGKSVPQKVPPQILDSLERVEINQSDTGPGGVAQGFQITFLPMHNTGGRDHPLLSLGLLTPGNRVVITVTLDGQQFVISDGIITQQQLSFDEGQSGGVLSVIGRDLSVLMDMTEKQVSHAGMKQKQIVEKIVRTYSSHGITPAVSAPAVDWPLEPQQHVPFQHGTDLAYVRDLAAANGYVFYIKPGPQPKSSTAFWGAPKRTASTYPALTLGLNGWNVNSINFAYDALAPTQVVRAQPGKDTPTVVTLKKGSAQTALAKTDGLSANSAFIRQTWLAYAGPDDGEAAARAQAIVNLSTGPVVSATGRLDALQYGDVLFAPGLVSVRFAGETFDGDYYISAVKHIITAEAYLQDFTLTREGIGSTKQRVNP